MARTPKTPGQPATQPAAGRPTVAISEAVLVNSRLALEGTRWAPTEKIIYWAGVKRDSLWLVTTVLRPRAALTWGSFKTTAGDNARVIAYLSGAGLALIGQVHTHPGRFVDHSDGDERDAFMPIENAVSIVVPSYGRGGILPLTACGVHRYEGVGYRRLSDDEVNATFCVVPSTADLSGSS